MATNDLYLVSLSMIDGIGPVKARNLISWCGSPHAVFLAPKSKLLKVPGIGPETVNWIKSAQTLEKAEKELEWCDKQGIKVLTYLNSDYPKAMKATFDGPLVLFQKGPVNLNDRMGIGIVGTRKASPRGKEIAAEFAAWFAARGFNVVSGLAYGIDIAAHRGVLAAGGVTTAVLGHGLDRVYPAAHAQRAGEIAESGALLSEFPSGTKPDAKNFPARNRIISGLCRALIVVEAMEKGGALITARFAFNQNREVYAVPGNLGKINSVGCNHLIRNNIAKLITHPSEVLDDLNLEILEAELKAQGPRPVKDLDVVLSANERKVLEFLEKKDAVIDQIGQGTGIGTASLSAVLLGLEFKGVLRQLPGKKFQRI